MQIEEFLVGLWGFEHVWGQYSLGDYYCFEQGEYKKVKATKAFIDLSAF